ncbi:hypothetical protein FACS189461_0820 [Spirochaetia bacterium]|nr:hypothetical protein FACS189461_0820 [Spirochaetia bacterium]
MLLLLHTVLYADDFRGELAELLSKNDMQKINQFLNGAIGKMTTNEKRMTYNFVLIYSHRENTLEILETLFINNIHAAPHDLYTAINGAHTDTVIDFILKDGAAPNGEILLLAAEKQRFNLVKKFIDMKVEVNYKYPNEKTYADGMTALIHAAKADNFDAVKYLVEHGAKVNERTKDGNTAASIALKNGSVEMYDYLLKNGATEAAVNNPNTAEDGSKTGQGIASVIENDFSLKMGTYRLAGNTTEIKLLGAGKTGSIMYTSSRGIIGTGYFQIDGSGLVITLGTSRYNYRIDTDARFSGNGETWARIGD